MKKSKIVFSILFIIIVILISLTGCDNKSTNEDIRSKAEQEIEYLDTQIVSILNKLNNISLQNYTITSEEITLGEESSSGGGSSSGSSGGGGESSSEGESGGQQNESSSQNKTNNEQNNITITQMGPGTILETDENDIDWPSIKNEIETINEAWGVIILDLSSLNVDSNDILEFSSTLDDCILSIKEEDKASALTNLSKLYSFIPKFERNISSSNSKQNIKQIKSYIINAYSIVEKDDWANIEANIAEGEKVFSNIINDIEYIKDKEYKVNKAYVLIKELQNSLSYKDKKLFYVKYKNLIESINVL